MLSYSLARVRVRRGRQLLAVLGMVAASAMLGASVTVAVSLSGGFSRTAARADLPDVMATFSPERRSRIAGVVGKLANVRSESYVLEQAGAHVAAGSSLYDGHATVIGVGPDRHGYAIVAGHDLNGRGEVVVEAGLARAWGLRVGDAVDVGYAHGERLLIVGIAVPPDTVAFPLTHGPRLYVTYPDAVRIAGVPFGLVNGADLWLADRRLLDVTLAQARSAAFGLPALEFVTRTGLQVLIGQAAGIVIAVVAAFSLIALLVVGAMLTASAALEVQRRLAAFGVLRALGVSGRDLVAATAVEAAAVALPATGLGVVIGWLVVRGPVDRLLASLNELPPGSMLSLLLATTVVTLTALVTGASSWPAWRATRRAPVEVLRAGDVSGGSRRVPLPAALPLLGVRLMLARPARSAATIAVIGFAVSVVLALLTVATVLENLNRRPLSVGKRYQLLVQAPPSELGRISRLPQVAAATPFYSTEVADSFSLDEPFTLVGFGVAPSAYEDPPLSAGREVRTAEEADVGVGLAQALGLHPGAVLAAQLPNGRELRFRVVGVVQALEDQGRVVFVEDRRLLAADASLPAQIAVRLRPGASSAPVAAAVARRGESTTTAGGIAGQSVQNWAARSGGFIGTLVALLRSIAVLDACVCLYAVGQALALTAQERRRSLAIIRAQGAGRLQLFAVFAGAAAALVLLATALAAAIERWAIGPGVAGVAASYVTLVLTATGGVLGLTFVVMLAGAAIVAATLVRSVTRHPVVAGLREE